MMNALDPKDRLILALDVPDAASALELVEKVKGHAGTYKIGLELFIKCGPSIVHDIAKKGKIFLDLKLHDIPATMKGAVTSIPAGKVSLLTVHASNSAEALRQAVGAAGQARIIAVTVLTSLSQEDLGDMGIEMPLDRLVVSRALMAQACGCAGVVCSVHEAAKIREACGRNFLIITPGIRPGWGGPPTKTRRESTRRPRPYDGAPT